MGGTCSTDGSYEKCIQYFGWKTSSEEITQKTRRRWEDNIRMDLGEVVWEDVDFMHLAQDRDQWRTPVKT